MRREAVWDHSYGLTRSQNSSAAPVTHNQHKISNNTLYDLMRKHLQHLPPCVNQSVCRSHFQILIPAAAHLETCDCWYIWLEWHDLTKKDLPTNLPPSRGLKTKIFRVAAPGTEKSSGWRAHKYIWIQIFSSSKLFPAAASSKLFRACLLLRSHQVEALQVLTLHMFVIKSSLLSTYEGGRALFQVSQWERCCCSTYPRHIQLDSTFTLHLKLS